MATMSVKTVRKRICANIKRIRQEVGFSKRQTARNMCMNYAKYCQCEASRFKGFSWADLEFLADFFQVPLGEFFYVWDD